MAKGRLKFETVQLQAKVPRRGRPLPKASQEEMCAIAGGVSDRTLRKWAELGLPVEDGPAGKPVYPLPEANIWAMCYQITCKESGRGRGPGYLTVAEAMDWSLRRQAEEHPEDFVPVPLDWSHPARARALQRAAEGFDPGEVEL